MVSVHRCRMFRSSGRSRDVFGALDGGAGAGHEGSLVSGALTSGCTKLYVLITELYGITGVMNILFGCDLFMCCNVDLCMY